MGNRYDKFANRSLFLCTSRKVCREIPDAVLLHLKKNIYNVVDYYPLPYMLYCLIPGWRRVILTHLAFMIDL